MEKNFSGKMRLVLSIGICVLFIAVSFSSAIGNPTNTQSNESKKGDNPATPKSPIPKGLFNFRILNLDWNYWDNKPNLFTIPTGNVGIGASNPQAKLDIFGNVAIFGVEVINESGMWVGDPTGLQGPAGPQGPQGSQGEQGEQGPQGPPGDSHWGLNGDDTFYTDGNVGIGTSTPTEMLDVAGTVQMMGFKMPTGASPNYVLTTDSNGVGTWQAATSSGQDYYDAVVALSGGDYSTVTDALAAGNKKIYVKAGTYTNETQWTITSEGTTIIGERRGSVIFTFSNTDKAIQINTNNVYFENLILRGSGTAATDYLIYCDWGKKNLVLTNCDLENIKHQLIEGGYSTIRLTGCKLNGTGGADWSLLQNFGKHSIVECCEIIVDPHTDLRGAWTQMQGTISGCTITGSKVYVGMDEMGDMISGCRFTVRTIIFNLGSHIGNYIYGNQDPGTDAVVTLQNVAVFSGNEVVSSYWAKKILKVSGHLCMIIDNFFESGKDIEIANKYVQFCNNIWYTIAYQIPTITLTADCISSQINENIVVGDAGYTPVIIDNGSNNNKLNNILTTV